jgi:hypothetical protein
MKDADRLTPFGLFLLCYAKKIHTCSIAIYNLNWREWRVHNRFSFCFDKHRGFYGHVVFGNHIFSCYRDDSSRIVFAHYLTFNEALA